MPHQIEVLESTKEFKDAAYYLDMGLGKTFVGAEKMLNSRSTVNLLVCQKSKIDDWIDHFVKYYEFSNDVMIYDLTKWKKKDWMALSNDTDFKSDQHNKSKYILVINYDLVYRRKELLELHDFTMMLDESSIIQNEKTKRTKFLLDMNYKNVILLSGTPTSGKYENLWSQCHLLGWDISQHAFNRQYINWKTIEVGGFPIRTVDKVNPYKNVERLKQKLRENGAVFMKTEEVIDLPNQTFVEVKVNNTREYRKFVRDSFIGIEQDDIAIELIGDTTLTKKMYARQLCGAYCNDKLQKFEDLLSSTQDRLIVFYNFNNELEAMKKICQKLEKNISQVNGKIKDLSNYENITNSVTLIQYQAGSMGLNLQKANKIIYFTLTERSELFEQSKKRTHRIGQELPCFYYIMICKNSVEEAIYETLQKRKDFTDDLFKEYTEKIS